MEQEQIRPKANCTAGAYCAPALVFMEAYLWVFFCYLRKMLGRGSLDHFESLEYSVLTNLTNLHDQQSSKDAIKALPQFVTLFQAFRAHYIR